MRSVYTRTNGSLMQCLSLILERIGSQSFIRFVEQSHLEHPAVEINPHIYLSDHQAFMEEGLKCTAEGNAFGVRVVFHGTSAKNIEPILRNGLDPNLRKGQSYLWPRGILC